MRDLEGGGRIFDLEDRLLEYAVRIVRLAESIPKTRAGNHVSGHLLRCGTSPLFNHGEAEAAESPSDFIHKLRVSLKELRESLRALRLLAKVPLVDDPNRLGPLLQETDELIRIFVASIKTAERNKAKRGTSSSSSRPADMTVDAAEEETTGLAS